jgi:tetratricopeptide (TPR) repeat protein
VANLGIQAAEALEHAHSLGVIHRDIKPANLMVDDRGTLWITDFGLARLQNDSALTMTGDLMGTPRYMSPEQALGNRVILDHRTDIYSLGVTLYEVLTLQAAFPGDDRQGVLRKIAEEEPIPPRRVNDSIPRELETILIKAMAKEPESRYATARELSDDLRRLLEHKPIKARRPTMPERILKWARRHTAAVVSSFSVLLLGVVALAISTVMIAQKESEAKSQRDKARERLALARAAVDDMYSQVATKWLAQQSQLEPAQRDFLIKALAAYERFAEEDDSKSPDLQRELALASQRAGEIRLKLGEFKAAEADLRRAHAIQETLATRFPATAEYRKDLATTTVNLALLLQTCGRPAESLATYREAVDLQGRLVAALPVDTGVRRSFVRGSLDLARCIMSEGSGDVVGIIRRALEVARTLARERPDEPENRLVLSRALDYMGDLEGSWNLDKSLELNRESLDLLEGLAHDFAGEPNYRLFLAATCSNRGSRLCSRGRCREAIEVGLRAVQVAEELARDFPSRPLYRQVLTLALGNQSDYLRLNRQLDEAVKFAERAKEVGEALVAKYSAVPDYREVLGWALGTRGDILTMSGRLDEADVSFARAQEIFDKLLAENSDRSGAREQLGSMFSKRVGLLAVRPPRGNEERERAIRLGEQAVAQCPSVPHAWRALGHSRYRVGDWKGALVALEKARSFNVSDDCDLWLLLALAHARLDHPDQATACHDKAVRWIKDHAEIEWLRNKLCDETAALLGRSTTAKKQHKEAGAAKPR